MENAELCLKNKFKVGDRVRLNPEAPEIITYLRRNKRNIVSGINSLMIEEYKNSVGTITRVMSLLDSCEQVVWIDWDPTSKWTWTATMLIPAKNFKKRRIKNHSRWKT